MQIRREKMKRVCVTCGEHCGIPPKNHVKDVKDWEEGTRHRAKKLIQESSQDTEAKMCYETFV